ncbi:hypothetical protein BDN67DRAFT_961930 [Paxillus ammoniavirescens]|nr:hypothetical protein BDN67DRAFT_961930 [Paxillus ammoniavirescens]
MVPHSETLQVNPQHHLPPPVSPRLRRPKFHLLLWLIYMISICSNCYEFRMSQLR